MRKLFALALLSSAVFAVSCSNEELTQVVEEPVCGNKMTVTMSASGTRTAMEYNGTTGKFDPKWTSGDQLGVFVRANGEYVDQNIATEALLTDTSDAKFSAEVTAPESDATYEFYTYYPYNDVKGSEYNTVKVEIPSEQHPANESFDPSADILSGYPVEVPVTAGQTEISELSLQFIRKTSIVRFLIPSCAGFDGIDGNTPVSEVKVYFDQNVTGTASWDITHKADLALEPEGASNVVTLNYTETHKITDPLWLSIAPVSGVKSLKFAFKVADNAYLYATANVGGEKGLSFDAGAMKKFSIPISATNWDLKSFQAKFVKVTSTPESWLGKYLIVGADGDPATLYACDQKNVGDWGTCSEVSEETDGSIISIDTVNSYAFDVIPGIADGTYAFKFTSGDCAGQFVSSGAAKKFNALDEADADKTDFTLTVNGDYVTVASNTAPNRLLRYNHNNGSGGLRFYDGTTGVGVNLYKLSEDYSAVVPVIANPVGIPEYIVKEGVTDAQFTSSITNLGKNSVSIKSYDGTVVTAASVSYATGTATVTYTVAANSGADRHGSIILKAGDTEKEIDIYQETGIVLPVISDVEDQDITYEASSSRSFDVTITNVGTNVISFETDGTVVTDASAALKEGNVYTVTYTVTANTGMESRNGSVTINCSTVSKTVNIIQDYNAAAVKTYKRVASLSDIEPGRYVIVASTSTITAYLPNTSNTTSAPKAETSGFTCTDSEFKTIDDSAMAWNFTGTTSAMTIKSAANAANYLYNISNSNGTRVGNTSDTWEIKLHTSAGSGTNLFEFKDANNNRYFGIYSNSEWRSYTSATAANYTSATGSSKIKLYIFNDGKTPLATPEITLTSDANAKSVDVSWTAVENASGYTVTCTGKEPVSTSETSCSFTDLAYDTEYTIQVTANGSELYRESSASETVTIKDPASILTTMDAIYAKATDAGSTAAEVTIQFNNWVISGVSGGSAYLTDGDGKGMIIYKYDHGFTAGDILSGTVTCHLKLYEGASEVTDVTSSSTGLTVTKGGSVTPQAATIDQLSGINTGACFVLNNITCGTSSSNYYDFSDGTNSIAVYKGILSTLPALTSGVKYNVTGVFQTNSSGNRICPRSNDDIQEVEAQKYAVTIDPTIENGSVTTSPETEATEGATVTLTATPEDGYRLAQWTVSTASSESVDVTDNKFTMPAEAVTVSATFEKIPTHTITISDTKNGTVETSPASSAKEGETVTISAEPADGYKVKSITVTKNTSGTEVSVSNNEFTMPDEDVTIAVVFEAGSALVVDFESATSAYTEWTFTNITSQQSLITAHSGSYHGTTGGKASGALVTKGYLTSPSQIKFFISKTSSNTKASNWVISVIDSKNVKTTVKTVSASSMDQGQWLEVSADLSSYSNVKVQIEYSGTTANRAIDDLTLE